MSHYNDVKVNLQIELQCGDEWTVADIVRHVEKSMMGANFWKSGDSINGFPYDVIWSDSFVKTVTVEHNL